MCVGTSEGCSSKVEILTLKIRFFILEFDGKFGEMCTL